MRLGMTAAGLAAATCLLAGSAFAAPVPAAAASPAPASGTTALAAGTTALAAASGSPSAQGGGLPEPVTDCLGQEGDTPSAGTPWAQTALDYRSVWNFTEGRGITVAVIDSGVDANPQFGDRVIVGKTLASAPSGPADGDCVGHGTSVAGIIAAAPMAGIGFAGVAPQATILSIKITNTQTGISPELVPLAIRDAVADGANVINLSLTAQNTPELQSAVDFALSNNVVVVAAAGNDTGTGTGPFYPAAYPGVLSVGAVEPDGSLASFSDTRTPVTVTAPGADVTATYPGPFPHSYKPGINGTSFATPFVSGVVALVRAYYPSLTEAQVVQRIRETADGAAGPGTGNGMVNPVQAITAVLPAGSGASGTDAHLGRVSINRAAPDQGAREVAVSVTAGALGLTALVLAAAVVVPAGRRRRWRPGGITQP